MISEMDIDLKHELNLLTKLHTGFHSYVSTNLFTINSEILQLLLIFDAPQKIARISRLLHYWRHSNNTLSHGVKQNLSKPTCEIYSVSLPQRIFSSKENYQKVQFDARSSSTLDCSTRLL